METQKTKESNESQISKILYDWADATRKGETKTILSNHAPDVLIFDVLAPLQYKGAEAYKKSWADWWPTSEGKSLFDLHELSVTASETVAFAHGILKCGNEPKINWVRVTFCLIKTDGTCKITHQHGSMPMGK